MFTSGLICILKAFAFQESDLKALRVFEIGFGSWMSLIFFIEQNRKTSTLRSFKVNENKCSGIQRILEILTKCVKTLVFFPCALSLLSCMSIEALMHSECLVCTCFQAPLALSGFSACEHVDTQNIAFNTNILLGWR